MANGVEERSGREIRLLVLVIVIAVAGLFVLARFRFPAADIVAVSPAAGPLDRLVARAPFEDLAASVSAITAQLTPIVSVIEFGEGPAHRFLPALRVRADRWLAYQPKGTRAVRSGSGPVMVAAEDAARELVLLGLSGPTDPKPDIVDFASAASGFPGGSYVLVVEAAPAGVAIRPVFIPRLDPVSAAPWDSPILRVGGHAAIDGGAFVFTLEGRFIGLVVPQEDGVAIVAAATLDRLAGELAGRQPMTRRSQTAHRELGGPMSTLRTRSALGLAPSPTPAIIFLPLGALLGPRVLDVLSSRILAELDSVVTIGLTVLGMLVGVALGRDIRTAPRLFAAASLESLITIAAVAGATMYFATQTGLPIDPPLLVVALALGLCASASSATSADPDSESAASIGTRVADLDDVLPMALASCAVLPAVSGAQTWILIFAPVGIGLIVGAIGWLLFERADSGGERVVFVLGTLGLAGGAASYLNVSPLEVGLVAGVCWTLAPGRADRIAEMDLGKVQHPLIVMLLLMAGALWVPSAVALWLLAPYLLFRLAGKVAGAWASASFADTRPADLAAYLMPPGVLAIAFALNFRQLLPASAGDTVLSAVCIGTAAFELFALVVLPRWRQERR